MADEKRPETFGDGSTREQQDALIAEHERIDKDIHEAAKAQREFLGGTAEQSKPAEQAKPAQSAQPEQKAKDRQPAT